jgi:hypothetical protein
MASTLTGGVYITFDKPYVNMVADHITQKTQILFKGNKKEVVKHTKEVKQFLKAVKDKSKVAVEKSLKEGTQFKPIFNGYKWTDILKAPYSGKGGSGGGAEATALTESMQCFVCSLAINVVKAKLKPSDITESKLKKAAKFCYTDRTLEKCLKDGPADWMDSNVYLKTANVFYNDYKSKFSGAVYFHRGSKFMNTIYAMKTKVHKDDRSSESPQAPGSFGHDKWNPGDIWASTFLPTENPLEKYTDSWSSLNERVAKLGGAHGGRVSLLGISLKKALDPKITKYKDPHSTTKSDVKYKGFIFGKNGDFFSSNDMYIHSSAGEMQCRTFSGTTSWQGEIKAKLAAGGKIGGGNIDFYTRHVFDKSVFADAGSEAPLLSRAKKNDQGFLRTFYNLYKKTNKKQMPGVATKTLNYDDFVVMVKSQTQNFINSKFICLILAEILVDAGTAKNNKFVNKLWSYAGSNTDQSSFYIKIH